MNMELSYNALVFFELKAGLRPDWTVEQVNAFSATFNAACRRAGTEPKDVLTAAAHQLWSERPQLMARVFDQMKAEEARDARAASAACVH